MTTLAKKTIQSKFLYNIKARKVRSQNERNAEKSTFITHQKSKKNNLQQKSKTFEKICKGVDGVRKSKSYHKGDNWFGIETYEMRNQTRLQIRGKICTLRKISFMTVRELPKMEGKQTVKSHL